MSREFFDCAELALNQESAEPSAWGNFGLWANARSYPQACADLATDLGRRVALRAGDRLLDLGFGMGEQLRLWRENFGVDDIVGLNPSISQCAWARKQPGAQNLDLRCVSAENGIGAFQPARFDAVIAVDGAYHFGQNQTFLRAVRTVLVPNGRLAWHMILQPNRPGLSGQAAKHLLSSVRIPSRNVVDEATCLSRLQAAGFADIQIVEMTAAVWLGFAHWWRGYRQRLPLRQRLKYDLSAAAVEQFADRRWLRYVLITARAV